SPTTAPAPGRASARRVPAVTAWSGCASGSRRTAARCARDPGRTAASRWWRNFRSEATVTIRVLLVDDQEMIRMGFRMVLESRPEIEVVGEADDGDTAIETLKTVEAD